MKGSKIMIRETVNIEQVRQALLSVLLEAIPLNVQGRELDDEMLWEILLQATVKRSTIESACNEVADGPSGNTVREHLGAALDGRRQGVVELEGQLNRVLAAQLPNVLRKQVGKSDYEVAIDFHEIPYHGRPAQDENEIRRGAAKSGTTHFHTYATAAIVHDSRRYELALTFVWKDESLAVAVGRLLDSLAHFGLAIRRAYLDKGFFVPTVLTLLQQRRIPYLIPIPLRGRKNDQGQWSSGIGTLFKGDESYFSTYTFNAKTAAAYTVEVALVRSANKGKHQQRTHPLWTAYACFRLDRIPADQFFELYRRRFGIESGYRQLNSVRTRTTSTSPALRLLLVALALLLLNTYILLRSSWGTFRHYGSRSRLIPLTLHRLALALARLFEQLFGTRPILRSTRRNPLLQLS